MKKTHTNSTKNKPAISKISKSTLIKGATAVAVTAGVVGASIALSNKSNRTKLAKGIKKGVKTINDFTSDNGEIKSFSKRIRKSIKDSKTQASPVTPHQIKINKTKKSTTSKRSASI